MRITATAALVASLVLGCTRGTVGTNDDRSAGDTVSGGLTATLAHTTPRCRLGSRPDPACTTGPLNPAVTDPKATICVPGWPLDARRSLAGATKVLVYDAYGVPAGDRGTKYVLDHLVPIEAGGAPDAFENLWPEEIADARRKDVVEGRARREICAGRTTVAAAAEQFRAGRW